MNKKRRLILGGALICFAFITFFVVKSMEQGQILFFDEIIRNTIIDWRQEWMTPVLRVITFLGNKETITFLCVLLLFLKRTRFNFGVPLALSACCSSFIQTVIKVVVGRARPPVENFLISQGGYSFPSGHSCTGLVFYGLFAYLIFHMAVDKSVGKIWRNFFIGLLLMIGFSRIYLGVHYPSDVLGGWFLGTAILMTAISVLERVREPEKRVRGI